MESATGSNQREWCYTMIDNHRHKIVTLACEGGGIDVFRRCGKYGRWEYFQTGASIALDEKDDELWNEWRSEAYDSLTALLDDAGVKECLTGFSVLDLDPDHRNEFVGWARSFWGELETEFYRRYPRARFVTPEEWVAGRRPRVEYSDIFPGRNR